MTTRIQPWTEPQLMDREHVFEALVEKALHKTMRALASEVADGILTAAATLPVDPATTGAYATAEGAVMAEWTAQVNASLYPFLTTTFIDSAARVVDGVQAASGIVVDQLTGTYADEVLQYAYNRMVGIGESLWLNIRDQLVEGYNAGESIAQIADRLTQVAGLTAPRANTVARTEIISAANNGSYLQMLDAGFDEAVTKVWLATEDTRTRLSHRHADNQGVELTGEFSVDIYSGDVKTGTEPMEFPGDPTATPGNIINCRCSLAFDFEEDAEEVMTAAVDFTEKDHPRDNDGKFKKKGAGNKYFKIPDVKDKPANTAPMGEKVAWMAAHKWDSMTGGQKGVLIQNIDEETWQKLPPELKDKILDAPSTTSHPETKHLLEKDLEKIKEYQQEPDDDADTDVPAAGGRPVGGVDTKTGKALVPGKPTKLRVQLLYNTTFADGAIMAVRKDSGERIVWDEKAKKINRQKLGDDGKYKTTESLSRGAAYAAWKDEDGWTVPDASDAAPVAAATPAAQAAAPAVGKPVKIKVQLIYQTPFEDGDIVAVHPSNGEYIQWDAKKKRMRVYNADGNFIEHTRGSLYKAYKDDEGWHLPADKTATPEPVSVPTPAEAAVPKAKAAPGELGPDGKYLKPTPQYVTWNGKVYTRTSKTPYAYAAVVASPDHPEGGVWSWHKTQAAAQKGILNATQKKNGFYVKDVLAVSLDKPAGDDETAKPATPDPIKDFIALDQAEKNKVINGMNQLDWNGLSKAEQDAIVKDADHWEETEITDVAVDHLSDLVNGAPKKTVPPAKSALPKAKKVVPVKEPFQPVPSLGGENNDKLKAALDDPSVLDGTILFEQTAFGQHTIIKKSDDGIASVIVNDSDPQKVYSEDALDTLTWIKAVGEAQKNDQEKDAAGVQVSEYTASDASNQIYSAWDTGSPGKIYEEGDVSVGLAKDGKLLFLDASPNGGTGIVPSSAVNSENIDKALAAVKAGKFWTFADPIPEVGEGEISAPGGSQSVSAGQDPSLLQFGDGEVDDFKDILQESDTFVGDTVFENDAIKLYKEDSDNTLGVMLKSNGQTAYIDYDDVDAEHLHDKIELLQEQSAPAVTAPAVSAQAQDVFDAYHNAPASTMTVLLENDAVKVYRATSGRLIFKNKADDSTGIMNSKDITPENIDKGIAHVLAGNDFDPSEVFDLPDVAPATTPAGGTYFSPTQAADIKTKFQALTDPNKLETLYEDDQVQIIGTGLKKQIGVFNKNGGFTSVQADEIDAATLENALQGIGIAAPTPAAPVISKDKIAAIQDWAKQGDIPAGEELHNGENFKIVKASSGAVVVYKKLPSGFVDSNNGQVLFGDEITEQGIAGALANLGIAGGTPAAPAVVDADVNLTVTGKTMTPSVVPGGKPMKLSAAVLTGKASQGYYSGQVIAEHPTAGERLVWNGKTKKYDVQVKTGANTWETAFSYNKQAALKNLKDDTGWVTPTSQVPNAGSSAGDPALAPKINGAPEVHQLSPKVDAKVPIAVVAPKPKISVADLQAQADINNFTLTQKNVLWNAFKSKDGKGGSYGVTLSSDPKDVFEGLLYAQATHNASNKGKEASLLQTLRLIDAVGAEKASATNGNLYEKKVTEWLKTEAGLKAAQKVSDSFVYQPGGTGAASTVATFNAVLKKFQDKHEKRLNPTASFKKVMDATNGTPKAHTAGTSYPELSKSQAIAIGQVMTKKHGALTSSEKQAMVQYTGSGYGSMNSYLRSFGHTGSGGADRVREAQTGMKPAPQSFTVHRNSGSVFDNSWQPSLAQLQEFKGAVFTEDAFASTSTDGVAFNGQPYRYIIEIPEGTPLTWVDNFSSVKGENEFMLAAGLKYEILEVTGPGTGSGASTAHKTAVIRMRVVP